MLIDLGSIIVFGLYTVYRAPLLKLTKDPRWQGANRVFAPLVGLSAPAKDHPFIPAFSIGAPHYAVDGLDEIVERVMEFEEPSLTKA